MNLKTENIEKCISTIYNTEHHGQYVDDACCELDVIIKNHDLLLERIVSVENKNINLSVENDMLKLQNEHIKKEIQRMMNGIKK